MRLVDTNFAGTAVGVGTAKICGRVHLAPIKIGGTTLNCTFTVMEKTLGDKNMEFLLGLDMLKRYQCMIDLQAPAKLILRAGGNHTTSVQFLTEGQLPESKGGALAVDPTIEENKETLKRKREQEAVASASSSSSSTTSMASPPAPALSPASSTVARSESDATSTPQEQLVSEGFEMVAVQKALADCGGNLSMARVVLKFAQSRS
jgi:DNA damage-inducible protein 1